MLVRSLLTLLKELPKKDRFWIHIINKKKQTKKAKRLATIKKSYSIKEINEKKTYFIWSGYSAMDVLDFSCMQ